MDLRSVPRLTLALLFLLVSASILCLRGSPVAGDHGLCCVSDYLFTINCSLTIPPSDNTSHWLSLLETAMDEETYLCNLKNTYGITSCSVRTPDAEDDSDIFNDMNTFEISLCHKQHNVPESCEVLDKSFKPAENIKPNAPCCLTVTYNSSKHHFTWRSTYEQYSDFTNLVNSFKYQLHYYKQGENVMSHNINTDSTGFSVDDQVFVPDSEYAAKVRSSPNQAFFRGQWSDWSSEVQWKTEPATNDLPGNAFVSDLGKKVFIPLCVMALLILLLCYAPIKKWKQNVFIPTPAPYFHTLYSNFQGDFRSWVVTQETTCDTLKAEETLQIDTLTKCVEIQEEVHQAQCPLQLMEGRVYSNIPDQVYDSSLVSTCYAMSNMSPPSDPGSSTTKMSPSFQSGSPAEGDSGCWLCSDTSLEKDPSWYCNDYCTLSTFQQSALITTEHHGNLSPQGIISVKAFKET